MSYYLMADDLEVTQGDIEAGKPGNWDECPIALAARRYVQSHFPLAHEMAVIVDEDQAMAFVRRFDSGESVLPCRLKVLQCTKGITVYRPDRPG